MIYVMDFYITTNMKVWTFAFRNLSAIWDGVVRLTFETLGGTVRLNW